MTDQKIKDELAETRKRIDSIIDSIPAILKLTERRDFDFANPEHYLSYIDDWELYDDDIFTLYVTSRLSDMTCDFKIHKNSLNQFVTEYIGSLQKEEIEKIIANIWVEDEKQRVEQRERDERVKAWEAEQKEKSI